MSQRDRAYEKNMENIVNLLEVDKTAKLLDLGCDDGVITKKFAEKIETQSVFGYEIIPEAAKKAEKKGVKVTLGDLNGNLKYQDNFFDVIVSNQVIEHLNNTDQYLCEVYRILKPGGYAVISTENLASWHNIFALLLGYMPFSLTNVSVKTGAVGNKLAPHSGEDFWSESSWQHQRVFTTKGLIHLFELFDFQVEKVLGAGYYPFGNIFSSVDPYHSAFITFKLRKIK
ncbi:MAG: class I SAM-dependent methyltransferase [Candidatus Dojkabacteria bacterium]|jgi:methionine biosynthesis protein MetW